MLILLAPSHHANSVPAVVIPLIILLLVLAIRFFQVIAWSSGKPGCTDVVFTLGFVIVVMAFLGGLSMVGLLAINDFSAPLAWLAIAVVILIVVSIFRKGKMNAARESENKRRWQEDWDARHKDDLCNYCAAFKTGDGEIHHLPSCRDR